MSPGTQSTCRLLAAFPGAALIVALTTSCGGGSDAVTDPGNPSTTVASVTLGDSTITLEMGFSHQVGATVRSSTGAPLAGIPIVWSSDNPGVALMLDGNVTAISLGVTRITASAGGKSASAVVTVIPTIVISVQLSRTKLTIAPGRMAQLTATPLDAFGRPIGGRAVSFKSSDDSIVSVAPTGLLTAIAEGTATITASSDDRSSVASVLVAGPTQISITANGSRPDGFPSLNSFSITLRDDEDSLTAATSSGPLVTLSGQMLLDDSVQFVAQAGGTTFLTSRLAATRSAMPASVPIVFIPRIVSLSTGPFAGNAIETSMDAATASCSGAFGNQCANGFYGQAFRTGVTAWPSLPIPVLLDGFSSADSAALWDSLHALEDAVGRRFFVPADDQSTHRIAVGFGGRPVDATPGSTGFTKWSWDPQNRITDAQIWFASSTPTRSLAQHEFLHALGFWHTCSWPSVMGGYGCPQLTLSANDAAYVNLAYAVFSAETAFRLPNGSLPCGAMGVWNATLFTQPTAFCNANRAALLQTNDSLRRTATAQ